MRSDMPRPYTAPAHGSIAAARLQKTRAWLARGAQVVRYALAMLPAPLRKASYEEYLALERGSETKHEYVNGEIYAMAGGTPEHGRLAAKVARLVGNALAKRPCEVFSSDVRIRVEATGRATYPDLSIVCSKIVRSAQDPDAITNPIVLIEVLSPSTEMDDRGNKWAHYRRLPSLECYVLVSQEERSIETYRREGRRWIYESFGPGEVATIAGADATLSVDELYASALEAG
jgi:Uma2 family endonuclease